MAASSSSGWVDIPPPAKQTKAKPKRGKCAVRSERFEASSLTLPYPTELCTRGTIVDKPSILFLDDEASYQVVFVDSCHRTLKRSLRNLKDQTPDTLSFIELCTLILKDPGKIKSTLKMSRWLMGYFDYNSAQTGCSDLVGDSSAADHISTEDLSDKINSFLHIRKDKLFSLSKELVSVVYFYESYYKPLVAKANLCQTCAFNLLIIFVKSFTLLSHALSFRRTLFDNISKENLRRGFDYIESEALLGVNIDQKTREICPRMVDKVLHRLQAAMMYHHNLYGMYSKIKHSFFDTYEVQTQKLPKGHISNSGDLYPNVCEDMGLDVSDLSVWTAIYLCLCVWQKMNQTRYRIVLFHMLPEPILAESEVFFNIRIVRKKDKFVIFDSTNDPI